MDNEGYQKELFEEFDKKPKKTFPGLKILPKADFEGKVLITISLEKAVFVSIGIILAMTIVFALGVERGRITASEPDADNASTIHQVRASTKIETAALVQPAPSQVAPVLKSVAPVPNTASNAASLTVQKNEPEDYPAQPYTIIAMTFKERETAVQAVNWLKKEGFQAYQKQDGQFFPVCVGPYATKNSAQSELVKVKRFCKDAYIKIRQ
ncbi:MAG: SPOR domain-containing protein [Candidatus Omnitrophica bacterium]|nr:SPOR domain-containing protein [Candidatus Omnitrophota bacterium]